MMESHQTVPTSPTGSTVRSAVTPESDFGVKRKRQPRNSACQGCAALKMKCIATATGKCERCTRMGRECLPAVPKPRSKRRTNHTSRSSISQAVPLSSILQLKTTPPPPSVTSEPTPRTDRHDSKHEYIPDRINLAPRHDHPKPDSKSFASMLSQGLGNVAACEELLVGIDHNFVAESFAIFRRQSHFFPFVDIPAGVDSISMASRRPLMTVAICTVATSSRPEAQGHLSQAFRYALSSKVLLGGERGIDLLLGLLVFLAWNHHYMSQQQIYQELYLLAGMAADLGLYSPRPKHMDTASMLERDRAFVGCYYLCACLSATGFDKPNPMRWTDNLHRCAETVGRLGTLGTDRSMTYLIELVHALDIFEQELRDNVEYKTPTSQHHIDLHTKAASQRFKALKRDYPTITSSLAFGAATIHIHYKLIRASETPDSPSLIQCACAIKEYLEDILSRPPSTLHQLAIVDWTNLLEVLVLMARVSRPLPSNSGWEAGALTSMLQPDIILDSIYSLMASAPSNDPYAPRNEALLQGFRGICEGIKRRIVHDGVRSGANPLPELGPEGRFRPVNYSDDYQRPRAHSYASEPRGLDFDVFGSLSNGILDKDFWRYLT